jgi:hypothetical protein
MSPSRVASDPSVGVRRRHLPFAESAKGRSYSYALSLKRWILPVAVLGNSATYSTQRGYL